MPVTRCSSESNPYSVPLPSRRLRLVLIGLALACFTVPTARTAQVGDVVFATDFDGEDALTEWSAGAKLGPGRAGGRALFVERSKENTGSVFIRHSLPVSDVKGCILNLEGWIRAEEVSSPPRGWNGIKYMAPVTSEGGMSHPQAQIGSGSFNWKQVRYAVRVPPDATKWELFMGLEAVNGRVWFDDLRITVRKLPFSAKTPVVTGPMYRGHDLPRLRGAMVSPNVSPESLETFATDWNANVIRWQLTNWKPKGDSFDLAGYDRWLKRELTKLDAALPLCEKHRMYVVVDLHSKPGGGPDSGKSLFTSPECQDKFVANWQMMARRYKDSPAIWGYDLANEPNEKAVSLDVLDWQGLAERAARAIREIDQEHAIIVEPTEGGGPNGFVALNPIDVSNVVYSVHVYIPHTFTHQGVRDQWPTPHTYPGTIGGQEWTKDRIEQALKPVLEFQKTFNAHIYVGEFSAIRWAPDSSAYRYLRDCIDIFESHDWDWTYHAFREWTGWSVEHTSDRGNREPATTPTKRQTLMRKWLRKNKKPTWKTPTQDK
ncbi:MAG: cellulase family glycosylhydrolase [Lentisphaerae bacterium]|jgi:endoglucanase|nr:cellulase family glycosylhydrolase [Lentisphaerota bacterium]MBT4821316.1 cellulase family glycosylhydrolase [Lentisphaerota bacterium]MBT5611751.1 cellulase family glycosylhydrolase [Lentisphaerota bacterium]MBT7055448.1 cellulase family glycosylhydrolase [Lentisphaerota bacterium]MBT7846027.1 cellulase family glycosylhydrolase [Lentisphaerota bacterium]